MSSAVSLIVVFVYCLLIGTQCNASGQQSAFPVPGKIAFPEAVRSYVVGEFTGDNAPDLAVLTSTIQIVPGIGNGKFGASVSYPTPSPLYLAMGDMNDDGLQDLITIGNATGKNINVHLNAGAGSFPAVFSHPTDAVPSKILTGDFDNNGHLDIAVLFSSSRLALLRGNGDGTLQAPLYYTLPVQSFLNDFVGSDFNGDGRMDLAVASRDTNSVFIFLANSDGTLQEPVSYPVRKWPGRLAANDLNGDGKVDLVVVDPTEGSLLQRDMTTLQGNGDGTFTVVGKGKVNVVPEWAAVADINRDGKQDLIAYDYQGTLSVALGNGDFTYQSPLNYPAISNSAFNGASVVDLTGDGFPEVLSITSGGILVFSNNGQGMLRYTLNQITAASSQYVATADFNRDGLADVAAMLLDSSVTVQLSRGNGLLSAPVSVATGGYNALAVADFNNDGAADIVVGYSHQILLNRGDGTFLPAKATSVPIGSTHLQAADLNGDGRMDLVLCESANRRIRIALGRGDGTFSTAVSYSVSYTPDFVATGDLNNDGKLDVLACSELSDVVIRFLGKGDGTLQTPVTYTVGDSPLGLALGDFNEDGKLDVVTSNHRSNDLTLLTGVGNGSFQPAVSISTGGSGSPYSIIAADLNADGHLDLASADRNNNTTTLIFGSGDGTFAPPTRRPLGKAPRTIAAGDLNGDGRMDLVAANDNEALLSVVLNYIPSVPSGTLTATAGLEFSHQITATANPLTFSAVGLPQGLSVDPVTGRISGETLLNGTFPVQVTVTNDEGVGSGTVNLLVYSAADGWRLKHFGAVANSGAGADGADPDQDGKPNLLEQTLGTDPRRAEKASTHVSVVEGPDGEQYLALEFQRSLGALDIDLTVQVGDEPGQWQDGSIYRAREPVVASPTTPEVSRTGTSIETIVVRDSVPLSTRRSRFMRLKVER